MKSRKVLLGLFVGLFVCCTAGVTAQTKANYQNSLIEIGPDNVGGRVRAIVQDKTRESEGVIYAGAAGGGLFVRDNSSSMWSYVPYYQDGKEITLPISFMVQHPAENTMFIATGENGYQKGINTGAFVPMGRGIFRFNPTDNSFTVIPATVPQNPNSDFASVNRVACMYVNGSLYFFAATPKGLFRWIVASESDWNNAPTKVFDGNVDDFEMIASRNMAIFTSGNQYYRIGNVTALSEPVNVSSTNTAFGGTNSRIELAVAPSNGNYVYAMVVDEDNLLQAVYLCKDQQSWVRLTTSTITPFNSFAKGDLCGAIAVHPANPGRVYVGGASLWEGVGYVEGSYYQWNKLSYSEQELNGGDYMSQVYSSNAFVHSGIQQVMAFTNTYGEVEIYVTTNGGIYRTYDNAGTFVNMNLGLNNVHYNAIDVCPDGSIIGGALDNACPFIEARLAHYGGTPNNSWYDANSTMNHRANVLWKGSGGYVAASMFQQVKPNTRRAIYVSGENGSFGRAYGDYSNYTNTQTWTTGSDLIDVSSSGPVIPHVALWETDTNTVINDSLLIKIDSNNFVYTAEGRRKLSTGDVVHVGDTIPVVSPSHFNYPFNYIVTEDFTVTEEGVRVRVSNPLVSRAFIVGKNGVMNYVYMNWYPTDFRRVCNQDELSAKMNWPALYSVTGGKNIIHAIAPSRDGNTLFLSVVDTAAFTSYVIRVRGLNAVNYCTDTLKINSQLSEGSRETRVYTYDTISFNGQQLMSRPVSSFAVNQRNGEDEIIITFGGYSETFPAVLYVANASADNYQVSDKTPTAVHGPAYSAMFEYTTGEVYIGSEEGVYVADAASFATASPSWNEYGAFNGVPVTSMRQQVRSLSIARNTVYSGINREDYVFAKTKYPYAMYFGTYGRGVFADMQYVTDTVNEIVDSSDRVSIPVVQTVGLNSVSVYPNPASVEAQLSISLGQAGTAMVVVYDLSGRKVATHKLGHLGEGDHSYRLDCRGYKSGMYLVNVVVGSQTAATKLVVR